MDSDRDNRRHDGRRPWCDRNAVGINQLTAPLVPTTGNAIAFYYAGLGGNGAFPLGVNGGPGIAAPIL